MNKRISRRSLMLAALISGMSVLPQTASATVVVFQTVMGNFEQIFPMTNCRFIFYLKCVYVISLCRTMAHIVQNITGLDKKERAFF